MTDNKESYRYSIGFGQSMTSGVLAFHGSVSFDNAKEVPDDALLKMLQKQEEIFQEKGYKVASIIPNNLKQLANNGKEGKGSK